MRDLTCLNPAVLALGDDLLIERNLIEVPSRRAFVAGDFVPGTMSRGGLQIGGTSERVRVIDNLIRGGSGNGITLGSLIFIDDNSNPVPPSKWPTPNPVDPCNPAKPASILLQLAKIKVGAFFFQPASAGALSEIVITRNRISQMGMNGIGVVGYFDLAKDRDFIVVMGLSITGNEIRNCLRRELEKVSAAMVDLQGYGGISLSYVERLSIRDNFIADNGPSHIDPVCGIFLLYGVGVEIDRNRIVNNGIKTQEPAAACAGLVAVGGINIVYAIAPMVNVSTFSLALPTR